MTTLYPYLIDPAFLKKVDESTFKEQYVKIIVLDWQEYPIAEIQGSISGGSINLDGSSAVRRSGSLTFLCEDDYYNVLDVNNLISINKKIKIEVGYTNTFGEYEEYDTLWFPQGVFVIINPNITYNNQGLVISISFKDKMCLLNGECGGVLPASVTFSEKEDDNGVIERVRYNQIIRELVSEFGGEQVGKIIINDVPDQIKKVMKWNGAQEISFEGVKTETLIENRGVMLQSQPSEEEWDDEKKISLPGGLSSYSLLIYGVGAYPNHIYASINGEEPWEKLETPSEEDINSNYFYGEIKIKKGESTNAFPSVKSIYLKYDKGEDSYLNNTCPTTFNVAYSYDNSFKFEPGKDVGYIYTNFCPTSDLIGNAGQNVVTILDTIKKQLGNYEYFYDIDGNFVFQEIRNYLNTTQSTSEFNRIKDGNANGYLFTPNDSKSVYSFENGMLVSSYQNTPSYANVKNDFIVWGTRESAAGAKLPIRYHVAFDEMPKVGNEYGVGVNEKGEVVGSFFNLTETYVNLETTKGKFKIFNNSEIEVQLAMGPVDSKGVFVSTGPETFSVTSGSSIKKEFDYSDVGDCEGWTILQDGQIVPGVYLIVSCDLITVKTHYPQTEIYLQGLQAELQDQPVNHMRYYTELKNEWNKIFKLVPCDKSGNEITSGTPDHYEDRYRYEDLAEADLDYFLDIIDSPGVVGDFSIQTIGVRSKVWTEKEVNCIFEKEPPKRILIETGRENTSTLRAQAMHEGMSYYQLPTSAYNTLAGGGYQNSAFNAIRDILYQYTNYNESITLTTLPIYYLEPNTRITVEDEKSSIHGDYMIKSISRPFDCTGTMNITATKALERF